MGARVPLPRIIALPLLASLVLLGPAAQPASAAYQASADSNMSAFRGPCVGFTDTHPARMLSLAVTGLRSLGYAVSSYSGAGFNRAGVLARTVNDYSF